MQNFFKQVNDQGLIILKEPIVYFRQLGIMRANRAGEEALDESKPAKINYVLENDFFGWHIFELAIKNKARLKRANIQLEEDDKYLYLTLDVFELLEIEKTDVPAQRQEIIEFLDSCTTVIENEIDAFPHLAINNEHDHNRTSFSLRFKDNKHKDYETDSQRLTQIAQNSVTLNQLFRRVAIDLNKIGRYSWAVVRTYHLVSQAVYAEKRYQNTQKAAIVEEEPN